MASGVSRSRSGPRPSSPTWSGLLVPFLCLYSLLFLLPLARLALVSLTEPTPGIGNYVQAVTQPVYWKVFGITFNVAATVTAACLLLGYPFAYVLATGSGWLVSVLWALVLVPFLTSLLVRTYAWLVILGRRGIVNQLLTGLGVIQEPLDLLFNRFSVTVGMVHILLPFMILCLFAAMRGIDTSLLLAAENLGATPWQAFLRIFVPLSLPGVVSGSLIVFITALGFYITPALLGGRSDFMIALLIDDQVSQLFNWGMGSALAFVLIFTTMTIFFVTNRILGFESVLGGRHE